LLEHVSVYINHHVGATIIILNDFNSSKSIVCISWTNKELNIINMHGATTKKLISLLNCEVPAGLTRTSTLCTFLNFYVYLLNDMAL